MQTPLERYRGLENLISLIGKEYFPTKNEIKDIFNEHAELTAIMQEKRVDDTYVCRMIKEYLLSDSAFVGDIEAFLGYPISADILEELEAHIDEVMMQMPDKTIKQFYDSITSRSMEDIER